MAESAFKVDSWAEVGSAISEVGEQCIAHKHKAGATMDSTGLGTTGLVTFGVVAMVAGGSDVV